MNPIDYASLTTDQRIILMLQKQDDLSAKVVELTAGAVDRERRLTILETEHQSMKANCAAALQAFQETGGLQTRHKVAIGAGVSAGAVGIAVAILDLIRTYLSRR
jgi:hypothetical protein